MYHSQAMTTLRELNDDITRPNQGSVTRWGGMIDIYMWVAKYWDTLLRYREPEDCVENDDGTRYVHVYMWENNLVSRVYSRHVFHVVGTICMF